MSHVSADLTRLGSIRSGSLEVRLAQTLAEIEAAQRLRYDIFYREMAAQPTPAMEAELRDFDDYDMYMRAGSAGALATERGMEQIGFWKKVVEHPAYDAFWKDQAVDKVLAAQPLKVPVMLTPLLVTVRWSAFAMRRCTL